MAGGDRGDVSWGWGWGRVEVRGEGMFRSEASDLSVTGVVRCESGPDTHEHTVSVCGHPPNPLVSVWR